MPARKGDTTPRPWRLFIALPMPASDANRLVASLGPYVAGYPTARWQRPDSFHVTLRFLGSTAPGRVEGLVDQMRVCADGVGAFHMATGTGDGVVRSSGGVAWLRITGGEAEANHLSGCLDERPSGSDSAPAAVPPHLTVARRADGGLIQALRHGSYGPTAVEWFADSMVLYRSHTGTPAGSAYESLAVVPFGPGPAPSRSPWP